MSRETAAPSLLLSGLHGILRPVANDMAFLSFTLRTGNALLLVRPAVVFCGVLIQVQRVRVSALVSWVYPLKHYLALR